MERNELMRKVIVALRIKNSNVPTAHNHMSTLARSAGWSTILRGDFLEIIWTLPQESYISPDVLRSTFEKS